MFTQPVLALISARMRGADLITAFAMLRQLRDIGRDPPRLVFREQLGCCSPLRLLLEINIRQLLADAVRYEIAGSGEPSYSVKDKSGSGTYAEKYRNEDIAIPASFVPSKSSRPNAMRLR